MNINLQYLLLCICTSCIKLNRSQICTLDMECHFFDWLSWSPCTGTCGSQTRYTDRHMCCSIQPATIETCLTSCNESINFPMHRTQSCRICENGGALELASMSCKCGLHFKGDCCQDVVTCRDDPCKHGTCTDQGTSFLCTCDEKYTGVTCDSQETSELLLPEWLSYLEYAVVTMVSLTGIMVLGCLCLRCCQVLGVSDDGDSDEDDEQGHTEDLVILQNRPKPMGFNRDRENMF